MKAIKTTGTVNEHHQRSNTDMNSGNFNREELQRLVKRIVECVHPLRIVLFGSTARGEACSNSDFDLLIVMPDGIHRRKTAQHLYRHLWGSNCAKDLVVVTESDVREQAQNPSMVIMTALVEGQELYCATR